MNRYAIVEGKKVLPTPKLKNATCPGCGGEMISACGKINIWHFRHKAKINCDTWHEPITQWHLDWQDNWPESQREVFIKRRGSMHRADVLNEKGTVLEFQHSTIDITNIQARESFYGKMIWVFDASMIRKNFKFQFTHKVNARFNTKFRVIGFCNLRPKKYMYQCKKPVFLDFGTNYLYWLNFYLKGLPRFRHTDSFEESHGFGPHAYTSWDSWTTYHFYPMLAVPKTDFLKHYMAINY